MRRYAVITALAGAALACYYYIDRSLSTILQFHFDLGFALRAEAPAMSISAALLAITVIAVLPRTSSSMGTGLLAGAGGVILAQGLGGVIVRPFDASILVLSAGLMLVGAFALSGWRQEAEPVQTARPNR